MVHEHLRTNRIDIEGHVLEQVDLIALGPLTMWPVTCQTIHNINLHLTGNGVTSIIFMG